MELLEVQNLRVSFRQKKQLIQAVRGVSFSIRGERESVGIVGESGSGKSVSGLAIMRLIEEPPGRVSAERLMLSGVDLLAQRDRQMQSLRGREISMVFQEPMSSLDPVFTIGQQLVETIVLHQRATRKQAKEIAAELLRKVEIPEPKHALESYPHELSGGMRQRAMIAIALSCHPRILIADEPTTALDVTVQAQVLQLIKDLQGELGMALILITHDLGVIADTTDRIVVMYGGKILETGSAIDI
ncbi:MAG TPA: ABC transporter ATP-binding protein, partial [Spirochaetia bacterium]|nr:ABC transporter ATP-binding protein [Spirochaetia bacterium]